MPRPFSFTGTSFATLDSTSGIENLEPVVNRPGPCTLSSAVNVRFRPGGGVGPRPGFTQMVDMATSAKVDSCGVLNFYGVTFWKSGTVIHAATKAQLDVGTSYTIGVTRTATEKDFFFANEKDIFVTNETDSYLRIAVGKVTAINSGAGTFSLSDGSNFASGTVYIRGTAITGGTLSTNDFSGCTGLTGSMAIGDIVTQTSTPSGAPKGTCIASLEGSALVGKGSTIFVSLPSNDQEPELFYDFTLTSGATAKRMSSNVNALKTGLGVCMIGMSQGIDVATGFEPNTGALLTLPLSRVHSVPNAQCICEMDREFAVLTSDGRILIAMQTVDGFQLVDDPNNPRQNFDYRVQGHIQKNKDQSDNSQNCIFYNPATKTLKATILMKDGLTQDIICQRDIGAWSIDDSKNISCRLTVEGVEYAGDDSDDKIHKDEFGTTDNGTSIISRITTGRLRLGRKGVTGDYLGLTYGGTLSENGQFYQRIIVNDQIFEELVMAEDMIEDGQMSTESGVSLGEGEIGPEIVGGEGLETEVFSFNYPYEVMAEAEYVTLEWEFSDEGTQGEIRFFDLSGESENELLINPS